MYTSGANPIFFILCERTFQLDCNTEMSFITITLLPHFHTAETVKSQAAHSKTRNENGIRFYELSKILTSTRHLENPEGSESII